MQITTFCERAPITGALFVWCAVVAGLWQQPVMAQDGQCPPARVDERVVVDYVVDGDTVALKDGRRVRLIGLDTPELHGADDRPQPYAREARQQLKQWLKPDKRIGLQYDTERHDKYQRVLAHAYLSTGDSITARMLEQGLAVTLVVPPNLWGHDCYSRREEAARQARRGVWQLAAYQPLPVAMLAKAGEGFHLLTGKVVDIQSHENDQWLVVEDTLRVQIKAEDLPNFAGMDLPALHGHRVQVRGWAHRAPGGWQVRLRHPAGLQLLE
ncbi:MAG: hypothetical protein A2V90_01130 [Gammaproteobacteria bacterium RBG_16_57_12]|nr:MAG: hypothetical protein A2V90_01130 [Gammaproteobacteria bacterium RBG_16_57_12]